MKAEKNRKKTQPYMWCTLVSLVVLTLCSLPVLANWYLYDTKLKEAAREQTQYSISSNAENQLILQEGDVEGLASIALNGENEPLSVSVINDVAAKSVLLTIDFENPVMMENVVMAADLTWVKDGRYQILENSLFVELDLQTYGEVMFLQYPQEVKILFSEPARPDVILDMCAGAAGDETWQEREVLQQTIEEARRILEEQGLVVHCLGDERTILSDEERVIYANETEAQIYVRVSVETMLEGNEAKTTAFYNGDYFLPEMNSLLLATILEEQVLSAIGGAAGGLAEADANNVILMQAQMPAAEIRLGYYKEAEGIYNIAMEEYRLFAGRAIANSILEAYGREQK